MLAYIRNRFHPLWRLRQLKWFRHLQLLIDFPVFTSVGKIKMQVLWLRNFSFLVGNDIFEERTKRCFEAVVTGFEPTLFMDVGANLGIYSWQVLNVTDEADIWLFEPDKVNIRLLTRTIARNHLDRVTLHPVAVFDQSGDFSFLVDNASGATGSLEAQSTDITPLHNAYGISATQLVPCIALDSLLEKMRTKRVLIKIDVEGAEDKALRGARQILREIRPVIIIECFDLKKIMWVLDYDYIIRDLKEVENFLLFPVEIKKQVETEWLAGVE